MSRLIENEAADLVSRVDGLINDYGLHTVLRAIENHCRRNAHNIQREMQSKVSFWRAEAKRVGRLATKMGEK